MKLSEYLRINKISHKDFAQKIGVTRSFITNVLNKKRNPSLKLCLKIEAETKGKVKTKELFNPNVPPQKVNRKNEKK